MSISKMFFLSMVFILSACSSDTFVSYTGNMPSEERISDLRLGQTKQDVIDILGAPSSVVPLDRDTWMYMSSEIKQIAFMPPEEIDRNILVIKFNKDNKISAINKYNKKHGEEILISEDATADHEQEQGFFQKYFGGVGQYMPIAPTDTGM